MIVRRRSFLRLLTINRYMDGKVKGWVKVGSEAAAAEEQIPETYEEWVERYGDQNVILTSAENGTFKIAGLDDGTYFLREIQAPNGYNLLEGDVQLVITADTANGQAWNSGIAADALRGLTITVNDCPLPAKIDRKKVKKTE